MKKKIIMFLTLALAVVFAFAGCSQAAPVESSAAPSAASTQRIRQRGTLGFGIGCGFGIAGGFRLGCGFHTRQTQDSGTGTGSTGRY